VNYPDRYRWIALSNTTLGVLMAMLNSSIVIISLPAIFRAIRLDPLQPANVGYLLWTLMGYLLVVAVFVLFGRLGDIFGFLVFTAGSLQRSREWLRCRP
jgi:MFS family permease